MSEEVHDQQHEASPNDQVVRLDSQREKILRDVIDLYNCKASEDKFVHFSDDVVFDDLLAFARGIVDFKAEFYAMPKLLVAENTSCRIIRNDPEALEFELGQKYTFRVVKYQGSMLHRITLTFDSEGKVKRLADMFGYKPILREGLLSEPYKIIRMINAKIISFFVRAPDSRAGSHQHQQ